MLVAYYSKGTKSGHLFKDLKIAKDIEEKSHYKQYLNQCDVLFWDMTWFITNARNIEDTVKDLQRKIIFELKREFTDLHRTRNNSTSRSTPADQCGHRTKVFYHYR